MNKKKSVSVEIGPGFYGCLGILFIGLKLTGYITWSWFWVLSPLWMPLALLVFLVMLVAVLEAATK